MRTAEVVGIEPFEVEVPGEEACGEWGPRQHAEAALDGERQDLALRLAVEQAVLVLKRGDGADRERALDLRGGMVGDAAVAHLPFRDQALHLRPGLLDR